jgi:predicted SAM-dependent methyltransferase
LNFDNSFTVRIARYPLLPNLFCRSGLQRQFAEVVRNSNIQWANAANLPLPDHSVEVLYTCHMLEHLDQNEVRSFLKEAKRVLTPDGILRVVVPDIRKLVDRYLETGDSNEFIANTLLTTTKPRTLPEKLIHLLNGHRNHHWMYDETSMKALLTGAGFSTVNGMLPGETMIPNPEPLNLFERPGESLYVEARM